MLGENLARACLGLALSLLLSALAAPAQSVIAWGDNSKGQTNVPPEAAGAIAVAAGYYHNVVLRPDGVVVAWGDSTYGQTNVPPTATNVTAIAAAGNHTLALRADGTVVAWGQSSQFGSDPFNLNLVPASATNVVAVAAGDFHNLVLRSDGTVVGWGVGETGQPAAAQSLKRLVSIFDGFAYSMAIQENGSVVVWEGYGPNYGGGRALVTVSGGGSLSHTLTNVVTLAAGYSHKLALLPDGSVQRWGDYTLAPASYSRFFPPIPASATNVVALAASTFTDLRATAFCDFALRSDGSLVAWGVGAGTNVPPSATNLIAIAAGVAHGVALQGDGSPRILGSLSSRRQISVGDSLPLYVRAVSSAPLSYRWLTNGNLNAAAADPLFTAVPSLDNTNLTVQVVVSNALGSATSAVYQVSVRPVNVWGDNRNWQRLIPEEVMNPVALAAGGYHCLALSPDGTLSAWGKNVDGQTSVPASATNVVAVAAGGDHSLALRGDRTPVAWGRNWDGQTNIPPNATNIVAIAAGYAHNLALRADGTLLAWGNNEFGQTNVPALLTDVTAIAAGYYHNLALRSDGTVVAWGLVESVPPEATNVVAIADGWWHSLALRADGTVVAWGDDSYGQCDVPPNLTDVVAVSAGYYHSLALRADGTVVAWGKDYWGVTELPTGLRNVAAIAAGRDFNLALVAEGPPRVVAGTVSPLGHVGGRVVLNSSVSGTHPLSLQWYHDGHAVPGATAPSLVLTDVQPADAGTYTLGASNVVTQVMGPSTTLQVQSAPVISGLGQYQNVLPGSSFQLAPKVYGTEPLHFQWQLNQANLSDNAHLTGSTSPTLTVGNSSFTDSGAYTLVVGNAFGVVTGVVAQVSVSSLLAWGDGTSGQIEIPIGLSNVVTIAAGGDHNLALRTDGTLAAWGESTAGRNTVPLAVTNVVAVAEGEDYSLALRADGTVLAWGDNTYGQTAVPTTANSAIAIAAGKRHSLALLPNGTILTWGYPGLSSGYGLSLTAIPSSVSNVVAIAAGDDFSVVLRADGAVVGWGDYPRPDSSDTVRPSISNAVAIAAGAQHMLALRRDGTVVAWGHNYYGQATVPPSVTNVVAIAAGGDHNLAVKADGSVVAWGGNYFGQTLVPAFATDVCSVSPGGAHSLALTGVGGRRALQALCQTVSLGQPVVLDGTMLLSGITAYQWQLNGVDLAGATTPALALAGAYWTNTGTYQLIASNSLGQVVGPSIVLTVARSPLLFDNTGLAFTATDGFTGRLTGASGLGPIVLFATTDFGHWNPILTNPPVIGDLQFVDAGAPQWGQRFYRAVELAPAGPPLLGAPQLVPDAGSNSVLLRLTGLGARGPVVIYASPNLKDWQPIFTNPATIGPLQFLDHSARGRAQQFYRAAELGN